MSCPALAGLVVAERTANLRQQMAQERSSGPARSAERHSLATAGSLVRTRAASALVEVGLHLLMTAQGDQARTTLASSDSRPRWATSPPRPEDKAPLPQTITV